MNLGRPLMKGIPWILLLKLPETPKVSGPLISAYVELGSNYYTLYTYTKNVIPFSISKYELLKVFYCFHELCSKCVAYLSKHQYCLNHFRTALVSLCAIILNHTMQNRESTKGYSR